MRRPFLIRTLHFVLQRCKRSGSIDVALHWTHLYESGLRAEPDRLYPLPTPDKSDEKSTTSFAEFGRKQYHSFDARQPLSTISVHIGTIVGTP
jgi:hypothetical protein